MKQIDDYGMYQMSYYGDYGFDEFLEVGVFNGDTDKLQWSVLYNLTTGNGEIFAHRNTDLITKFYLPVN